MNGNNVARKRRLNPDAHELQRTPKKPRIKKERKKPKQQANGHLKKSKTVKAEPKGKPAKKTTKNTKATTGKACRGGTKRTAAKVSPKQAIAKTKSSKKSITNGLTKNTSLAVKANSLSKEDHGGPHLNGIAFNSKKSLIENGCAGKKKTAPIKQQKASGPNNNVGGKRAAANQSASGKKSLKAKKSPASKKTPGKGNKRGRASSKKITPLVDYLKAEQRLSSAHKKLTSFDNHCVEIRKAPVIRNNVFAKKSNFANELTRKAILDQPSSSRRCVKVEEAPLNCKSLFLLNVPGDRRTSYQVGTTRSGFSDNSFVDKKSIISDSLLAARRSAAFVLERLSPVKKSLFTEESTSNRATIISEHSTSKRFSTSRKSPIIIHCEPASKKKRSDKLPGIQNLCNSFSSKCDITQKRKEIPEKVRQSKEIIQKQVTITTTTTTSSSPMGPKLRPKIPNFMALDDWPTARVQRVASLNAMAKVHILYENEGRTVTNESEETNSSESERSCDEEKALVKAKEEPKSSKKIANKKQPRRTRKREVVDSDVEIIDTRQCKRMANLNAQAIMAASYCPEKRSVKKYEKSECEVKVNVAVELQGRKEELQREIVVCSVQTKHTVRKVQDNDCCYSSRGSPVGRKVLEEVDLSESKDNPEFDQVSSSESTQTVESIAVSKVGVTTEYREVTKVQINTTKEMDVKDEESHKEKDDVAITRLYRYHTKATCLQMQTTYKPSLEGNYSPPPSPVVGQSPQRLSGPQRVVPPMIHNAPAGSSATGPGGYYGYPSHSPMIPVTTAQSYPMGHGIVGSMPLVTVSPIHRHYGSAFSVPHYGHPHAVPYSPSDYGYYQPAGPLIQPIHEQCLIHKPVPYHPQQHPHIHPTPPPPAPPSGHHAYPPPREQCLHPSCSLEPLCPTGQPHLFQDNIPCNANPSQAPPHSMPPPPAGPTQQQQTPTVPAPHQPVCAVVPPAAQAPGTHQLASQPVCPVAAAQPSTPSGHHQSYPHHGLTPAYHCQGRASSAQHYQPASHQSTPQGMTQQPNSGYTLTPSGHRSASPAPIVSSPATVPKSEPVTPPEIKSPPQGNDFSSSQRDLMKTVCLGSVAKDVPRLHLVEKDDDKEAAGNAQTSSMMRPQEVTCPEQNYASDTSNTSAQKHSRSSDCSSVDSSSSKSSSKKFKFKPTSSPKGNKNVKLKQPLKKCSDKSPSSKGAVRVPKGKNLLQKMDESSVKSVKDSLTCSKTDKVLMHTDKKKVPLKDQDKAGKAVVPLSKVRKELVASASSQLQPAPKKSVQPKVPLTPVPRVVLKRPARKSFSNGWTWEGEPYKKVVFVSNEDSPHVRKCFPAMRHSEGDVIRVRDCVLLRSGPRKIDLPFVAKIAALWENPEDGEMMMSLLWYYRPEHTDQGRKPHHMTDEVFASKHRDANSVACIDDKCYVLTYAEYCRYRAWVKMLEEDLRPKPSVVSDIEDGYARKDRLPPGRVSPGMVFFCRKVYDFRQKRILKNPT